MEKKLYSLKGYPAPQGNLFFYHFPLSPRDFSPPILRPGFFNGIPSAVSGNIFSFSQAIDMVELLPFRPLWSVSLLFFH
jgi:hypothetical protein